MRAMAVIALVALVACESPAGPGMRPENAVGLYTPTYPDAPFCDAGTNGAWFVRIHSYYAHNPPSVTVTPESTAEQRKLAAEVYSYDEWGSVCRNMTDGISWTIVDAPAPPLVTQFDSYSHIRIKQIKHKAGVGGGLDRVIATVTPGQTCCPLGSSPSAADTILVSMQGF